jgi:hypothetical protein
MGFRYGSVGPRGLTLLAVAGLVGLLLAVHGWSGRGSATALGSISGNGASAAQHPASKQPAAPASTTGPTAGPTAGPNAGATPGASAPGPLLSSQQFAPYAFPVWPGKRSQAAQAALAGLTVTAHRQGTGISVTASVNGQPPGAPHFYPLGVRVYVVEASMGDDSGNSDYNLGDDGIVVTDAHGRIVQ